MKKTETESYFQCPECRKIDTNFFDELEKIINANKDNRNIKAKYNCPNCPYEVELSIKSN